MHADAAELVRRTDEILEHNLYTLRMQLRVPR
jgi:hypothetical protein